MDLTVKDLAAAYSMSVKDLCQKIEYTPQGLNRVLKSDRVIYPNKFRNAIGILLALSDQIEASEKMVAFDRGTRRLDMLDRIAQEKGLRCKSSQLETGMKLSNGKDDTVFVAKEMEI